MTHNAHQLQPCFILCFPIEKTIVNHLNIMFLQRRHENKQFPPVLFLIKTFFHFNSQVLLKNKKGFRLFVVLVAVRSHFTLTDLLWFSHAVRGVSGRKKKGNQWVLTISSARSKIDISQETASLMVLLGMLSYISVSAPLSEVMEVNMG